MLLQQRCGDHTRVDHSCSMTALMLMLVTSMIQTAHHRVLTDTGHQDIELTMVACRRTDEMRCSMLKG